LVRLVTVIAVILAATASLGAQKRTPWGDPDLQGTWTNQTPVGLERPPALADKATFTEAESAAIEKNALQGILSVVASEVPFSGELNDIWLEAQNGKVTPGRHTSLIVDPPNGRIPYTPEGRARWNATPSLEAVIIRGSLPANGPEDRAPEERCLTSGGVFMPNPFYNNLHQIVQTRGYVAILSEMMHETRIIPIDGRPHIGAGIREWHGDARGHWEGETLVVDTTNFNDKRLFRGATRDLRLVERFTRLDPETISYRVTVSDASTFAAPWTIENALRKTDGQVYEAACHEGNYGLAGILSGARADEQRQNEP
jgi:hypothetical protein